jgi:formate dehydrogenase major subunit
MGTRRIPAVTPLLRQLRGDPLGLGRAARSKRSETLAARTKTADRVVQSICPYCAVGCGQKVYVKDERVVQIEGDPDSPISRGRLCPNAASEQLVNSPAREYRVKYRRPHGSEWESLDLETAMDMIADRVVATRRDMWDDVRDSDGKPYRRTLGFGFLGGATLDTEENYLIKKFFTAAGAVSVENQARI